MSYDPCCRWTSRKQAVLLTVTCFISEKRILLETSTMLSCRNFRRSHRGLKNRKPVDRRKISYRVIRETIKNENLKIND